MIVLTDIEGKGSPPFSGSAIHPLRRKTDLEPSSNAQRNVTVSVVIPAKNEARNLPHVCRLRLSNARNSTGKMP